MFNELLASSLRCILIVVVCVPLVGCEIQNSSPPAKTGIGRLVVEPAQLIASIEDGSDTKSFRQRITAQLVNRGEVPLKIVSISSSCGCMLAEKLTTDDLLPGGATTLTLNVDLPSVGRKATWVRVNTDSRETPQVVIPVILVGVPLRPPYLDHDVTSIRLHGTKPGTSVGQILTLRAIERRGTVPWIQNIRPQSDLIRVSQIREPTDEASDDESCVKRKYEFHVEMAIPDSADTSASGFLEIVTQEPSQRPLVPISVAIELRPIIRVFPDVVLFDLKASSSLPTERRLLLMATDGAPWNYEMKNDLPSWLSVEEIMTSGKTDRPSKQLRVVLNDAVLRDTDVETESRFEFTLKIDREGCSLITVPVIVRRVVTPL